MLASLICVMLLLVLVSFLFSTIIFDNTFKPIERIIVGVLGIGYAVFIAFCLNHNVQKNEQQTIKDYVEGKYVKSVKDIYVDGQIVESKITYKKVDK